ncbi:hypothetical protein HK097_010512 [Rhizophlyctis rosea]|uniref:Uncharacterized protein n=1 Tax=Rhizophlyctis rosea TaxID=64517 RepID=A0AAD5X341_9FUNG|nr:hypothetical protein HK097_010512 [Rhizophlyctis rosea]
MCRDRHPPTTFTEKNRKQWTDWLTKHASWPTHKNNKLAVKSIRVVKQHTWTDALKKPYVQSRKAKNPDFKARYLYHGTPECNIDKILAEGFRLGYKGDATWLAQSPLISVDYMRGGNKMILSSVLVKKSEDMGGVAAVKEPSRIVPIAVIEVEGHGYGSSDEEYDSEEEYYAGAYKRQRVEKAEEESSEEDSAVEESTDEDSAVEESTDEDSEDTED